jgi:Ni,Fe-hydrogenase III large subunit
MQMPELFDLTMIPPLALRNGPMPRSLVTETAWRQITEDLARGDLTLLSLWAGAGAVHMALLKPDAHLVGIASLEAHAGRFPSVGRRHPAAQRLERAAADLFGLVPEGAVDDRPWLDHGRWEVTHPLGAATPGARSAPYAFLPVIGESLHQVPVGPVHAGIIEPGHFRFTAQGETVVRLEERLGYVHKGIDGLMQGATLARGAELAGRTSGDSTVAFAWAFAQAAEAALGAEVPDRAFWLRALMAELERLANHLGDIGAICNDAAFAMMLAQCSVLRERVLRTADACFGHRFMRDRIVPGGLAADLDGAGEAALRGLLGEVRGRFPSLVELYDNTASLEDRTVGTGVLRTELAARFGAGGYVGRASGRDFDTRRDLPYAPYDRLAFFVPVRADGDVNARVWIRIHEVGQSLSLIAEILAHLPAGPVRAALPSAGAPREGLGLVEGFRGDILVWLALDATGRITRCHLRDPSWFQWPLLEAVIENNIIADFPLCNKSFNCSYSGHDL